MSTQGVWWKQWSPDEVTVGDPDVPDVWKTCVLSGVFYGGNNYNGRLGSRISSVFVILFVSTAFTLFPVVAAQVKWLRIPRYVYYFARYFGTGVIVATAFIHLLDPAYDEIGGASCVGQTGNWALYSWCPAIVLATLVLTFLVDLASGMYVERKYGRRQGGCCDNDVIEDAVVSKPQKGNPASKNDLERCTLNESANSVDVAGQKSYDVVSDSESDINVQPFESQIGAFLILEFGIIFHSVMIGLNLGTTGDNFGELYAVLVFHQSFEGLGIGARLSAISFPEGKKWWPYALCAAYGLTTPISIAIGLGVRTTYDGNSYNVNVVSGVLDAISAGILIYTGLVELLARDFLFHQEKNRSVSKVCFMVGCMLLGAGIMSLLGKWA
ncbi:LAME_0C06898g1_1 [Lachancea meyersii CBS 8951]|uniref:LAME_0C06898g1_1 n=1 Tax=Lachancea meyersii CBS 8951 TaxID=1266667 RepID=A0A1G4J2R6_9SACH|nr:LAME_0C06898g1_1 [Lachancea meyersii CBS 8951]